MNELGAQRRVHDLVNVLGAREVPHLHVPEVAQRDACRKPVFDQRRNRPRHQHLPTVRESHDPRRPVDRAAEEVAVAALLYPNMQAAAHLEGDTGGRTGVAERQLQVDRCVNGVERVSKRRMNAIAQHLHDPAAIFGNGRARDRVVARERLAHPLGMLLPQLRTSLDIGEQKGYDTR
jgi:hypothetical protein